MRRIWWAVPVLIVAAWLGGAAQAAQVLTLGAPQLVPSPFANSEPSYITWTYGDNEVTESYLSRPTSTKKTTVTYKWKLPTTVHPEGAKGELTISATGGDLDGIAPGLSISSQQGLVRCTGITNTPSPGSGCADGDHASVGVSVQPNQTLHATQEFLIQGGAGSLTIQTGGPKNTVYAYTASEGLPASSKPVATTGGTIGVKFDGEVGVRHGDGKWIQIPADGKINEGDEVFVGVDSHATLTLADGSTLQLNELTQLKIQTDVITKNKRDIELQLKLGAIKAQVQHELSLDTSFEIRQATATASVRGTIFTDFYDPGSGTAVISVERGVVAVDPTKPGLPTTDVPVGKEIAVTPTTESPVAPIGKAGARGGDDVVKARDLVLAVVAKHTKACALTFPRGGDFMVKPSATGWLVSIKASGGKARGSSTWAVAGKKVTPVNPAARNIARGCR